MTARFWKKEGEMVFISLILWEEGRWAAKMSVKEHQRRNQNLIIASQEETRDEQKRIIPAIRRQRDRIPFLL